MLVLWAKSFQTMRRQSTACCNRRLSSRMMSTAIAVFVILMTTTLAPSSIMVAASNDDYYGENWDDNSYSYYGYNQNNRYNNNNNNQNNNNGYNNYYNGNNNYYNRNNNNQQGNNNNNNGQNANGGDSYSSNNNEAAQVDDAVAAEGDDQASSAAHDDFYSYSGSDDEYEGDDKANYAVKSFTASDDDVFHWSPDLGFDGVSIMPISCINYNNGHMIKFQLFDSARSYQCHFAEISTFVVSIAHYMRAYFNYQALVEGKEFEIPWDAVYLNCMQMKGTVAQDNIQLYAKVGCMERETFTSTKLQLHLYTDAQCSQPYDDGQTPKERSRLGYTVGDYTVSTKVSFRPPFYSCLTCAPDMISGTFSKKNGNWYDDDYISTYGSKNNYANNNNKNQQQNNNNNQKNQNNNKDDDGQGDDKYSGYFANNDDVNRNDDQYQNKNGGGRNLFSLSAVGSPVRYLTASMEDIQAYRDQFWEEVEMIQKNRALYSDYYQPGEWNMCQRVYKYGVWCDSECRSLDFFRRDQWSTSDVALLAIMTTFMAAMMLLVVAKRLKAQQRARIYGDVYPMPGLPPFAMLIIFVVIMGVIVSLAKLKFINETLVFSVVTCILLFIYMLKLTLFESRRPVLLAAPRHDMFDNPLNSRFID